MIALNDWETFKRQIEFKKYYGDGDTATFKQEDKIGYAVDSTSKLSARTSLSIVYDGLDGNPKNEAATQVSIEEVNSKTSTIPGAPKSDVNKIAWRYVTPRIYNPVTGQIYGMNSQGTATNNAFPIQFDGEKVDTAVEDGAWTTTEGDVAKTGTAFGEVGTYGISTVYGFVNGRKATHNPPTVYITYYHNQPVVVTFEDVTDGEDKAINLSNFNAPELTWQSSNNDFVTRQESDNDVDTLQLKTTDTYQGTDTKYSYQAGDYTKQGALTTDSHATKANNAINGLTTLNYQDVLNAYLANGYAFVSADDDDLSYDKDKVWTKDSSTTENDGHKLNVLHRVIKLVRTATLQTATQTVTRNINFVADREGTPTLADPIKQTVTYTSSEFYGDIDGNPVAVKGEAKDANGNVMKDANGNILYIVDGTQAAAPITWTAKDGAKFNAVLEPTDSTNQITGQDTIEVTDGALKGDWIKFDTASESLVPAPTTINGEWNGYTQSSQDKTQYTAPDVTLVYYQEAHENSNSKTVNRVVHFKTVDGQILLKDIPVESVTFVQNYYTDGNGNVVSVKTVKNSNGQDVTVVKDVLTGQDAENAKAWKVSDGSTDFAQVNVPEITDGLLPGDWVRVSAERNSENGPAVDGEIVPAEEIQDTVQNGADQEYTIYYAQKSTPQGNPMPDQPTTPDHPVDPTAPGQPTQPGAPVETVTSNQQATTPAQPAKAGKLPQTGNTDNKDASFGALGLLGALLTGLGLGKKRRRN
ncbi:LPXTG cell wall anchor domain-containing protein [Limosilactobacillus caecicola]|uniref:LPXTG cell wall anchor domain-containing protein n=1 Tax=Limosilactobacillus caecicola TaxID=2941332 RepID=UPI00203B6C9B|nr:LPXTG cell wall anchor domain-containing protein [Limosilactobacillus caecicola]